MKKFNEMQIDIINHLSDGACHSGNELGVRCHVSRTAIWKHIKQLSDLGLPILRIPHQGYRLSTPLKLLQESTIRQQLKALHFTNPINFHLFACLDSTNRLLKDLPHSNEIDVCCAEMQTEGRGRFGRHWYSPFGENIYCSSRWHFECDLSRLSGLSLVVSLAILATLANMGIKDNICVKWPNDILWNDKKLCGNLIEIVAESNSSAEVIIGIGLNVNSNTPATPIVTSTQTHPNNPWCSLYDITDNYMDRNTLIANLLFHLNQHISEFIEHGFTSFITEWQPADYLLGKRITVSQLSGILSGIANGVNEAGQLKLIDDMGVTHYLSSGDTSLHK